MPKLQFLTAHLIDSDKKKLPERTPKLLYSCTSITATCEMPKNRKFSIRLSSGPIPFDIVVKVLMDGAFLAGRCFISGSTEPIHDYEIGHIDYGFSDLGDEFRMKYPYSKVQVTIHKCFVSNKAAPQNPDMPHSSKAHSLNPRQAERLSIAPVILHEDSAPFLSIAWECSPKNTHLS